MAGKAGRSLGHRCFRAMPLCLFKDRLFACTSDVKNKDELNSKKLWLKYNMDFSFSKNLKDNSLNQWSIRKSLTRGLSCGLWALL